MSMEYVFGPIWPQEIRNLPREYYARRHELLEIAYYRGLNKLASCGLFVDDVVAIEVQYTVNNGEGEIHTRFHLREGSASQHNWAKRVEDSTKHPETSSRVYFSYGDAFEKYTPVVRA